jgi:hypothetical protein
MFCAKFLRGICRALIISKENDFPLRTQEGPTGDDVSLDNTEMSGKSLGIANKVSPIRLPLIKHPKSFPLAGRENTGDASLNPKLESRICDLKSTAVLLSYGPPTATFRAVSLKSLPDLIS